MKHHVGFVSKIRHKVILPGGLIAEIDVYDEPPNWKGCVTAEIEFVSSVFSTEYLVSDDFPHWLSDALDVTEELSCKNQQIALGSEPPPMD